MEEEIFDFFDKFSASVHKMAEEKVKKKLEQRKKNQIKAQNDSFTKHKKSESMKKYWEKKKLEPILKEEEKERLIENVRSECTCFLGHAPCPYCEKYREE